MKSPLIQALLACLALIAPSFAAGPDLQAIQKAVEARFPKIQIDHVSPAPWPGLFSVFTPEEIVYTNEGADWVLMGQLLDARTQQNMTALAWDDFKRIDYKALPFDQAIDITTGKGTREIALFADPLCPFCKELETALEGIDDLKVRLFLYPLEPLHPGATVMSRRIWCAADRGAAWRAWMLKQQEPKGEACGEGPIARLAALGEQLQINSTPTLFLPDGRRVSGALTREQLQQVLAIRPMAATGGAAKAQ